MAQADPTSSSGGASIGLVDPINGLAGFFVLFID